MIGEIKYGNIYWVNFAPSVGHEFQGVRPAVVIQSDKQLAKTTLVSVMPLTSKANKARQYDILIAQNEANGLFRDSTIKVNSVESFDRSRFRKKIGTLGNSDLQKIKSYLVIHFGI